MELLVNFLPLFGVLALAFVFVKSGWVTKQDQGNEKMIRIAKNITDGAMAFLKAEYKILAIFVVAVAVLLYFKGTAEEGSHGMVAVSFIVGAICSALAGFIGMNAEEQEIFTFGKYKGQKVVEIFEKDPGYYGWIQNADFPLYTKKILTKIKLKNFNS